MIRSGLAGRPPGPRAPRRYALLYLLPLTLLPFGGYAISRQIKKEKVAQGSYRVQGRGREAWSYAFTREDGLEPPRVTVRTWIVVLGTERDSSHEGDALRLRGHLFRRDARRSWILARPPEDPKANVVLIGEDGRRIDLPRRVTIQNLLAAREAAGGFEDLEDLERRLLSALREPPR